MSGALPLISSIASVLSPNPDWRQRLRRASFRGARFYVESVDGEYGRRYVMHEYPGRDLPYAEDLGRKQRQWSFRAYTIGGMFLTEREAVVRACEQPGPGRLVHPMLGSFDVVCTTVTFTDSRDRGGYSILTLAFAEAGELRQPEASADNETFLERSARALDVASQAGFLDSFDVSGGDTYLAPIAAQSVVGLADHLDALRAPSFDVDQSPLVGALDVLRRGADSLVFNPTPLWDRISDAFGAYTDATDAERGLPAMLSFFDAPVATSPIPMAARAIVTGGSMSPIRHDELTNAAALTTLEQQMALREIGYLLPGLDLDNTVRAITVRREIVTAFDRASNAAADAHDDAGFAALIDLLARVLAFMDAVIGQLPALVPYQTPKSMNALVLSWTLYQDADRDLELVARTGAPTPAFMPTAGMVLER